MLKKLIAWLRPPIEPLNHFPDSGNMVELSGVHVVQRGEPEDPTTPHEHYSRAMNADAAPDFEVRA